MKTTVLLRDPALEDQNFDFPGPVDEALQYLAPIAGLLSYTTTDKNKSVVVRLSALARTLRTDARNLFDDVRNRLNAPGVNDPRIINLNDGSVSITTETDGESYRYTGAIEGSAIWGFTVNSRQSVEAARAYLTEAINVGQMLENFLASVQDDFPNTTATDPVFQPVDEQPLSHPEKATDDEPDFAGTLGVVEALPRSPSLSALMGKSPTPAKKVSSVNLMICKPGGPWIVVEIISPAAGMIKNSGFVETLNDYLKDKGSILPMQQGFHLVMVNPDVANEFDQIIRSALHDHNALEGATIEHHEYDENTFDPAKFI